MCEWKIQNKSSLTHYGVKGMRWGVRKEYIPHPRESTFSKPSNFVSKKSMRVNKDGSLTVPKGYSFNRVGKSNIDVNKSGGFVRQ